MSTPNTTPIEMTGMRQFFFDQAEVELKRAERYRVFVSLLVLDVSSVQKVTKISVSEAMGHVESITRQHIRACDYIASCGESCLVALFPETSRQGAEIAGKRLSEAIRAKISELSGGQVDEVVPLEMASYPDAAGARSVSTLLADLANRHRN